MSPQPPGNFRAKRPKRASISLSASASSSATSSASPSATPSGEYELPVARAIDWTYAGIPGGIPTRNTIHYTIDAETYGDGETDATSEIQTRLNACPDDQVVYLPAGTYIITEGLYLADRMVLRGAGPGVTILKHMGSDTTTPLTVYNDLWTWKNGAPEIHNVTEAIKDAQAIMLDAVGNIAVGDLLYVTQENDGEAVTNIGTDGEDVWVGVENGTRCLGQIVEVTEKNGTVLSINVPLHWTYDGDLNPTVYRIPPAAVTRWVGLEDFTITQDASAKACDKLIDLQSVQYCWMKNVEITNILGTGFQAYWAAQCEFQGNYIHTPIDGYASSRAYGMAFSGYASNNLVENNILYDLSAGGIETSCSSGNVLAYNYFKDIIYSVSSWMVGSPLINHGAHGKFNLWEGNIGAMVDGDYVHGSGSNHTIYRCFSAGWLEDSRSQNNAAIRFAPKNRTQNVVGCVLGTSGKSDVYEVHAGDSYSSSSKYIWALGIAGQNTDTNVLATLLRHGNYDYVNNSTTWGDGSRMLPDSLYLSAKPSWWGEVLDWPPINPVGPVVGDIPAKTRFEAM